MARPHQELSAFRQCTTNPSGGAVPSPGEEAGAADSPYVLDQTLTAASGLTRVSSQYPGVQQGSLPQPSVGTPCQPSRKERGNAAKASMHAW